MIQEIMKSFFHGGKTLPSKDKTLPRYTERAIRKIVKIFSVEDASLAEDIAELEQKMKKMPNDFI